MKRRADVPLGMEHELASVCAMRLPLNIRLARINAAFSAYFLTRPAADSREIVVVTNTVLCCFPPFNSHVDRVNSPVTRCYGVRDVGRILHCLPDLYCRVVWFRAARGSGDGTVQALSQSAGCCRQRQPSVRAAVFSFLELISLQVLPLSAESRHDAR